MTSETSRQLFAPSRDSQTLLTVDRLSVAFGTARGVLFAANDVSFTVAEGDVIGLVGESGCGKTVTCRSILGLIPPPGEAVSGRVLWRGRDVLQMSRAELQAVRGQEIALVSQDAMASLNPVFTIGDQLREILRVKLRMGRHAAQVRAVELIDHVGIPSAAARLQAYPHELSGGMRQRVMIAMAIACRPKLLVADEPTTALDVTIQDQILTLLAQLREESAMSMILVSHDLGVIAQNCDRVCVMYAGRVVEEGAADGVFRSPSHPYTRGLLEAVVSMDATSRAAKITTIGGEPPDLAQMPEGCSFRPRCRHARDACAQVTMELEDVASGQRTACPFSREISG
jgi:oligopeptide/dipeptide ABC transporter ATP-binding protein